MRPCPQSRFQDRQAPGRRRRRQARRTPLRYAAESPHRAKAKPPTPPFGRAPHRSPAGDAQGLRRRVSDLRHDRHAGPSGRAATTDVQTGPRAPRRAGRFYLAIESTSPNPSRGHRSSRDPPIRDPPDRAQGTVRASLNGQADGEPWRRIGGATLRQPLAPQGTAGWRTLEPPRAMCAKLLIYKDKTTAHIGPFILPRALRPQRPPSGHVHSSGGQVLGAARSLQTLRPPRFGEWRRGTCTLKAPAPPFLGSRSSLFPCPPLPEALIQQATAVSRYLPAR